MAKLIAMSFLPVWIGLTLPISFSIAFTLLRPIWMKDTSGLSMIGIAIIIGLMDMFIGVKIFEQKIHPWSEKRNKKSHFP